MKAAKQANQTTEGARRGPFIQRQCSHCAEEQEEETPFISSSRVGRVQTKLAVGAPNDIYEQEADRIADQVMAMPAHDTIRRSPIQVQRVADAPSGQTTEAPASIEHVLSSPGQPLEPGLREEMEGRFGYDFSRVRIHDESRAAEAAISISAKAFTVGEDIVFGKEKYSLLTSHSKNLLAHELTHVIQQRERHYPEIIQRTPDRITEITINLAASNSNITIFIDDGSNLTGDLDSTNLVEGSYTAVWDQSSGGLIISPWPTTEQVVNFNVSGTISFLNRYDQLRRDISIPIPFNVVSTPSSQTGNLSTTDSDSNIIYLTPEEAQQRCQSGDLPGIKVFPLRMPGPFHMSAAPIRAYWQGNEIIVRQTVTGVFSDPMFREDVQTLPIETFSVGVRVQPNELIQVHLYDDREQIFCVTGEQMLQLNDASNAATIWGILQTVVLAGSVFVPGAAAGLSRGAGAGLAGLTGGTNALVSSLAHQVPLVEAGLQEYIDWSEVGFETTFGALTGIFLGFFASRLSQRLQMIPGVIQDIIIGRGLDVIHTAAHTLFNQLRSEEHHEDITFNQFIERLIRQLGDPQGIFMDTVMGGVGRSVHESTPLHSSEPVRIPAGSIGIRRATSSRTGRVLGAVMRGVAEIPALRGEMTPPAGNIISTEIAPQVRQAPTVEPRQITSGVATEVTTPAIQEVTVSRSVTPVDSEAMGAQLTTEPSLDTPNRVLRTGEMGNDPNFSIPTIPEVVAIRAPIVAEEEADSISSIAERTAEQHLESTGVSSPEVDSRPAEERVEQRASQTRNLNQRLLVIASGFAERSMALFEARRQFEERGVPARTQRLAIERQRLMAAITHVLQRLARDSDQLVAVLYSDEIEALGRLSPSDWFEIVRAAWGRRRGFRATSWHDDAFVRSGIEGSTSGVQGRIAELLLYQEIQYRGLARARERAREIGGEELVSNVRFVDRLYTFHAHATSERRYRELTDGAFIAESNGRLYIFGFTESKGGRNLGELSARSSAEGSGSGQLARNVRRIRRGQIVVPRGTTRSEPYAQSDIVFDRRSFDLFVGGIEETLPEHVQQELRMQGFENIDYVSLPLSRRTLRILGEAILEYLPERRTVPVPDEPEL